MIITPTPIGDAAHAVRKLFRPFVAPDLASDVWDQAAYEIIAALIAGGMRDFDIGTAAVITGRSVEGRVLVRMDGRNWSLPTLETALLALRIRLEPNLRGADLFADAFALASQEAEAKVAAVHDWSAGIRPTEDVE